MTKSGTPMSTTATPRQLYLGARYHLLHELRHVRAALRVGNTSEVNARRERKLLQRAMAQLRAARRA